MSGLILECNDLLWGIAKLSINQDKVVLGFLMICWCHNSSIRTEKRDVRCPSLAFKKLSGISQFSGPGLSGLCAPGKRVREHFSWGGVMSRGPACDAGEFAGCRGSSPEVQVPSASGGIPTTVTSARRWSDAEQALAIIPRVRRDLLPPSIWLKFTLLFRKFEEEKEVGGVPSPFSPDYMSVMGKGKAHAMLGCKTSQDADTNVPIYLFPSFKRH